MPSASFLKVVIEAVTKLAAVKKTNIRSAALVFLGNMFMIFSY